MMGTNSTTIASASSFGLWHHASFLIWTMAWQFRHGTVIASCLVQDVFTELSEHLCVVGIGAALTIFSDDTVLGHSGHCSNHTEAHLCGHVLHLYQSIIVSTIAEDGHHHTFYPMGIDLTQTLHCQSRNTSCKDGHSDDGQIICLNIGQL